MMAAVIAKMVLMKLVLVHTTVRNPEKNEMKSPVFRRSYLRKMEVLEEMQLMWQGELLLIERFMIFELRII